MPLPLPLLWVPMRVLLRYHLLSKGQWLKLVLALSLIRLASLGSSLSPTSTGSLGSGCSTTSSKVGSASTVWIVASFFITSFSRSSDSVETPSPQLPLAGFPSIVIPLSFNQELVSSPCLRNFCNSFNRPTSLPSSLISFCNCSLLFLVAKTLMN